MNYMAEVSLRIEAGTDITWIRQSLDAACRRFDGNSPGVRILSAVHVTGDGRLSCIVTAAGREDVERVFEIALLPPARIREVVDV
jgi:hypothetical protein